MSASNPRFAVVIPAYNEEQTVREIATNALEHAPLVIVVNDGSTDATATKLEGLPLTLLTNPGNRGKAASLCRGFECAVSRGVEAVITLDADGQHRASDIPRLLEAGRHTPNYVVIGARLRGRHHIPRVRRFGHMMADFWIAWAAGVPIRDTQSGCRLYPAALLKELGVPHGPRRSFVFESEVLIEAVRKGYGITWIHMDAIYGRSPRQSHYRGFFDTLAIIKMVAAKLLACGLNPIGLVRSLRLVGSPAPLQAEDIQSVATKNAKQQ